MIIDFDTLCMLVKEQNIQIQTDSRKIARGDIFVALPIALSSHLGKKFPPHSYIETAIKSGASAIVLERGQYEVLENLPSFKDTISYVVVENVRASLGLLAQAKYDTASIPFPIIAITGTNGKTTSSYILEHIYHACGKNVAILGTVSYRWDNYYEPAPLTTPDCLHIHEALSKMKKDGVNVLIMEVSSHALDQDRVAGIEFDGVIFTNLTQDHLDYHKDMENYFQAKKRLFTTIPKQNKAMSVYATDPFGKRILAETPQAEGYILHHNKDAQEKNDDLENQMMHGTLIENSPSGLIIEHSYKGEKWRIHTSLVGEHNACNLLSVECLALQLGFKVEDLKHIESFHGVPGRLERIITLENTQNSSPQQAQQLQQEEEIEQSSQFTSSPDTTNTNVKQNTKNDLAVKPSFFVDYAHTPDALVQAQHALRQAGFARIITVFGCGGDRDKTKRPLMGEAVAKASDIVILTSDNPRTENPEEILDDIMPGLKHAKEVHRIVDRKEALSLAVQVAKAGDAVLVAGKGHETYQIIGTEKTHFSDQEILQELLKNSKNCNFDKK